MAFFYTIQESSEGLYKEKGSKFISYLFPSKNEDEFKEKLEKIRKMHIKARHFCFAFQVESGQNKTARANDDGEPSGTAGRPILGQLEKSRLDNVGLVVVRYFGGTKLGVSGLIKAYKSAAEDAISNSHIVKSYIKSKCIISFAYESLGIIMQVLKDLDIHIEKTEFEIKPVIIIEEESSEIEGKIIAIKAKLLNRPTTDVDIETEIDGIDFTISEQ
jgi:uncharacterized YigZ family protein